LLTYNKINISNRPAAPVTYAITSQILWKSLQWVPSGSNRRSYQY